MDLSFLQTDYSVYHVDPPTIIEQYAVVYGRSMWKENNSININWKIRVDVNAYQHNLVDFTIDEVAYHFYTYDKDKFNQRIFSILLEKSVKGSPKYNRNIYRSRYRSKRDGYKPPKPYKKTETKPIKFTPIKKWYHYIFCCCVPKNLPGYETI